MNKILLTVAGLICASSLAHSASIAWSSGAITGDTSDIITSSAGITLDDQTVVTNVGFFGGTGAGADITTTAGTYTAADFETSLDSLNTSVPTYQMTGLTSGLQYTVQFFQSDDRNATNRTRDLTVDDGAGNTLTIGQGNWVTGTFEAMGTTQDITLTSMRNGSVVTPHVNLIAFSGGEAVPEPSSTALLGLGGLALVLRRRKY